MSNDTPVQPPIVINTGTAIPPGAMSVFQDLPDARIQTNFRMEVTGDDLVAIKTAAVEKQIREQAARIAADIKALQSRQTTLSREQADFLRDWTKAANGEDEKLGIFVDAARALTSREPILYYSDAVYEEKTDLLRGTITVTVQSHNSVEGHVQINFSAPAPKEFIARYDELKQIAIDIAEKSRELLSTRSALSNIEVIQRQAKAAIAKAIASKAAGGSAIIEKIEETGDISDLIDSLKI